MTYAARRKKLIAALGGKCAQCGTNRSLQFDHIDARHWHPENLSKSKRLRVYERAAKAGKIQLLCSSDHAVKSAHEGEGFIPAIMRHFFGPEKNPF
jgi:hypothetical protein